MEKRSSSRLAEWLDGLSRESWQLELIISGFSIFLLIGIYEPLRGMGDSLHEQGMSEQLKTLLAIPMMILMAAWFILLFNLCIHVLFRGLWISTVGLRSVSDNIDFDVLRLQPRFNSFLQRRIGSFDRYVERLERICSVLFAFTFLILFMLLAIGGMIIFMSILNLSLRDWIGLGDHFSVDVINILFMLGGILYFIDFVSLARLKQISWLAPVYYPVYRFFSLITLAALYRPLYYNLIDNRFGRRVGFLLVPYVIFLMIVTSLAFVTDAYFPKSSGPETLENACYDDLLVEDVAYTPASIPSRYVNNGFVELFIPYDPNNDDKAIEAVCPDLRPAQKTGLAVRGIISFSLDHQRSGADSLLLCMSRIHRIFVDDSLHTDLAFRFYTHPIRKDNGLLAILDVLYLPRGEHFLKTETQRTKGDSLVWSESARIPFWKE